MNVFPQPVTCSHRKEGGLHSLDQLLMLALTANVARFEDQQLSQYYSRPAFGEKRSADKSRPFRDTPAIRLNAPRELSISFQLIR